ncbi:MAG: DUF2178 domain-containing protein [Methanobacterium sp.]
MNKKTYNISRILIITFILVGMWISNGNMLLALLFVITGMISLYTVSTNINEVMHDERTTLIKSNASRMSMGIFINIIFLSGIVILVLNSIYPNYIQFTINASDLGFILCTAGLLFWTLYIGFHEYYSRKY